MICVHCRYKIDKTEKHFIIDFTVSVCMDAKAACQFSIDLLNKVMVPIPVCNLDMDFSLEG